MNNFKGILLMLIAMAGFTMEDLFMKKLSVNLSTGQILITLGFGSSLVFALMAKSKGYKLTAKIFWSKGMIIRQFAEGIAAVAFITSLTLIPLSTVAAVFQATPLVITMGAALFLGEAVGWRRWLAIIVGLIGVLIIIRPGLNSFDPNVGYVLIAVLFVTVRDLITRKLPMNVPSTIVSFQAFASLIIAGGILIFLSDQKIVSLDENQIYFVLGGIIFGVIGYYCIVASTRIGEAGVVTPFRYSRLLFAIIIGFLFFNERPDFYTLLGASIVIMTGIYTVLRERYLARRSRAKMFNN
ncbi:DMT family transporter [Amylibacter sp.]|jgi:drug/metabolite transporter (DMT)-like permease|nr:DMT family transporter [Amylibacter sp.]MDA9088543.1 DMT family transporter [Amylibacter sp.]MDA9370015.1 DMT family transporter [Amylibacter sp.]MDA9788094.1 DMT family transporter [Amylibacter sp.]MDB4007908.1 DMT family transporter [Amylibacter sp.]|tara:strand:+ start:2066 stop:2956 length:891 start_codon:yes stop_codon:yes gene_type:complete